MKSEINIIENKNRIEPFENKNFRKSKFDINNKSYEICISLYSNCLFVLISSNGKISSMFSYDSELEDEEDDEEAVFLDEEQESNPENNKINTVKISRFLFGDRRNEIIHFIANCLISYLFTKLKGNQKVKKVVLGVHFSADLKDNLGEEERKCIDVIKKEIDNIL